MHNILLQSLILHFFWKRSRLECLAEMIMSLIENCSVSGKNMELGIKGEAKHSSRTQRIYRFFRDQIFNYDQVAKFILNILANDQYIIALDRTCWKFGKSDINILFLVIVFRKISVPVYWYPLEHSGACSSWLIQAMLEIY